MAPPWDLWRDVGKRMQVIDPQSGLVKENVDTVPRNVVDSLIKEFKQILETTASTGSAVIDVNDPAAVYVAAHASSHPESSIVEMLMTTWSEQSLKDPRHTYGTKLVYLVSTRLTGPETTPASLRLLTL